MPDNEKGADVCNTCGSSGGLFVGEQHASLGECVSAIAKRLAPIEALARVRVVSVHGIASEPDPEPKIDPYDTPGPKAAE